MMRLLPAALIIATPIGASAQLRPSEPEAVAEAVADCWAAVGPEAVSRTALAASGWTAGTITGPPGEVETPLQFYGKSGSNVVLMLMSTGKSPVCSVTSRISSGSQINSVAEAIQRRLTAAEPQVKTARSGSSTVFMALPKIAMLDATGTKAQPAVRIAVGYHGAERG